MCFLALKSKNVEEKVEFPAQELYDTIHQIFIKETHKRGC